MKKQKKKQKRLKRTLIGIAIVWFITAFATAVWAQGQITEFEFKARKALKGEIGLNYTAPRLKQANFTSKEAIWGLLEKTDLTFDEKIKAMSIIECESRFNQYAIGINNNGLGIDLGYWQINEKFHKKRVEEKYGKPFREVAFNLELSTDYALTLFYENGRSFKLWSCN